MLSVKLDKKRGIAVLKPRGALSKKDFERAATVIDPYLENAARLNGLIIHTKRFPGWDSFTGLVSHLTFVKSHHKKVKRIALCTDSVLGDVARLFARHFISATVRLFPYEAFDAAGTWAAGTRNGKKGKGGLVKQRRIKD
jgi:SpoIIAA-like